MSIGQSMQPPKFHITPIILSLRKQQQIYKENMYIYNNCVSNVLQICHSFYMTGAANGSLRCRLSASSTYTFIEMNTCIIYESRLVCANVGLPYTNIIPLPDKSYIINVAAAKTTHPYRQTCENNDLIV